MHERPADYTDTELAAAIKQHWGLNTVELTYAAVGFGGYHWTFRDPDGACWFATLNEVPSEAVFADLTAAMATAASLATRPGLEFLVAPVPSATGVAVCRAGADYALTLFPFVYGAPADFGDPMTASDRAAVIGMLAALHSCDVDRRVAPMRDRQLTTRSHLDLSLRERGRPWRGGPYAEPARALLSEHAAGVQAALAAFDQMCEQAAADGADLVITHGEPHPGNLLRRGSGYALIDWDTAGLALPERDLWCVLTESGQEAALYGRLTGREVNESAVAMYRLRWDLDEISLFLADFRAEHVQDKDTEVAWAAFGESLDRVTAGAWR